MAKAIYQGVSGVARKVKQPFVGVSGVARKVKNAFVGVSGVARGCYESVVYVTVTITGNGTYGGTTYAGVVYNGTTYTVATTLTIPKGTVLQIISKANGITTWGNIYLNGTNVNGSNTTYNYTVNSNSSIALSVSGNAQYGIGAVVRITTS